MGELVILSYLFSPIIISVALLTAHLFKRKFLFTIPPLLTIIYTIHKFHYIKQYGSSGPGGGFEVIVLPVLGLSVLAISYTIWAGLIYIKKNWRNKRDLPANIAIFLLVASMLTAGYHYRYQLITWPRVKDNTSWNNILFWDLVFRGYCNAPLIRFYLKNRQIDRLERSYIIRKFSEQISAPPKESVSLRESVLETMADIFSDDSEIPRLVSLHPSTTSDLLGKLSKSSNKNTVIAVAQNPKTSIEVLTQFYETKFSIAKYGLAKNPNTPNDIRIEIIKDESPELARDARFYCSHWKTCEKVYQVYEVRTNFSENPYDLPKRESARSYGRLGHPVSNETWLELSRDSREYIRTWVAKNYLAPPEILASMQNDSSITILQWLILNNNTPTRIKDRVAARLSASIDRILLKLAKSKSKDFREGVALNTATSVSLLDKLSHDDEIDVRSAVAENPKLTTAVLERMVNDPSPEVLSSITKNSKTPLLTLRKLEIKKGYKYKEVRRLARVNLQKRGLAINNRALLIE